MSESLIGAGIGTVIGGIITWVVACLYYVKSSNDLKAEAKKLRTMTTLILRTLEDNGQAEFSRDSNGNIVGMKFRIAGANEISLTPSSTTTFTAAKNKSSEIG